MLARRDLLTAGAAFAGVAALPAWTRVGARGLTSFPAPTREAMVPVTGGRVYVRVNGDLSGRLAPIVFVHGGPGGTHASFLEALPLADERAVILYDQLDSGRSDRPDNPANWRVPRFVDELEAIRAALGVSRWHVCGHSWGGTIALEYGARRPAALRGLALASPLVSTRSWIADADRLRTVLPPDTQAALARCDTQPPPPAATCTAATDDFYAHYLAREPANPARAGYRGSEGRGFNPKLYEAMWGASEFVATGTLREYDGEPLLAKLNGRRTLFVSGQYDEAQPSTLAAFARRVPGAEWAVVPGSGHALFNDRPEETLAILRGWLTRQDAVVDR